ncbi:MAG TPA: cyclase family protein [Methylomirabilota bacterium]|nr:cyclase family protein [Methylomirabilota bacterium]
MELPDTLIDLSHPIESGMRAYPGLPSPRIEPLLSHAASRDTYAGRAEFTITRIFMAGNTGTYLDSPWHRWPDGEDLSGIPLERLAGLDGVCVDGAPRDGRSVTIDLGPAALHDRAVLIRTRWDREWGTDDYWTSGPYLHPDAIALLADAQCRLVGVDFANVDDTRDPARPAHTTLLREGILVVEHLRGLERVPAEGFTFSAVPPAVRGASAFPVRAFATVRYDRSSPRELPRL